MEDRRLTYRSSDGWICYKDDISGNILSPADMKKRYSLDDAITVINKLLEKLSGYEDLSVRGLLVTPPCRVGDIVYVITGIEGDDVVYKGICHCYTECILNKGDYLVEVHYEDGEKSWESFSSFGETLFLDEELANKKLSEIISERDKK